MSQRSERLRPSRRFVSTALGTASVLILSLLVGIVSKDANHGALAAADATVTADSTPETTLPPPTTAAPTSTTTSSTTTTTLAPASLATTTTTDTTTTTTSTDPPTTTTDPPTTTSTTLAPLRLEADGLGVVRFGASIDETIQAVATRLGGATSDSGWVNARGVFGTCPGSIVRVIRWDSLRLFFSNGPTDFGEDTNHFFYYSQSTVETDTVVHVVTPEGVGIGSTVVALRTAYGDRLNIESTIDFGVIFFIDPIAVTTTEGEPPPGLLSGTLTESFAEGVVTSIAGGFGCGA